MHGLIFETSICYWKDQPDRPETVSVSVSPRAVAGAGESVLCVVAFDATGGRGPSVRAPTVLRGECRTGGNRPRAGARVGPRLSCCSRRTRAHLDALRGGPRLRRRRTEFGSGGRRILRYVPPRPTRSPGPPLENAPTDASGRRRGLPDRSGELTREAPFYPVADLLLWTTLPSGLLYGGRERRRVPGNRFTSDVWGDPLETGPRAGFE